MLDKDQQLSNKPTVVFKPIVLYHNSSEEEIMRLLKQAPFALTVRIAAAIGHVWQESA